MNKLIQTAGKGLLILSVLLLAGAAYAADTKPPKVSIVFPGDGDSVLGPISVNVSASDRSGIARVEFYIDGAPRGECTETPYSYLWNTEEETVGYHSILVKGFDNAGNESSDSITVMVREGITDDVTPPTVWFTSPEDGDIVGGEVSVTVHAEDASGIYWVKYWTDDVYRTAKFDSPYEFIWIVENLPDGIHSLRALAEDNAGNVNSVSISVTVDNEGTGDPGLPEVSIDSPVDGQTIDSTTTILVSTSDGLAQVSFYVDDEFLKVDKRPPYSYNWDTETVDDGSHVIMATAVDRAGNEYSDAVTVTVDNGGGGDTTPPEVSITAPAPGATVSLTTTISVSASDAGGVDRVEFYIDGDFKFSDPSNSCSYSWDTTSEANGDHLILVKAFDNSGNMGAEEINVIVQNGSKTITKYYNAGDQQIARYSNAEGLVYLHNDHLGSTSRVTNTAGTLVKRVGYTPYGSDSYTEDLGMSVNLDYLFTGQEKDDTGLYYYGSRYYDPELGRFTTSDALIPSLYYPQGLNPYSYCYNNPVNFVDPDGENPLIAVMFIGAIIGGTVAAINGGDILEGMFMGAVSAGLGYGVSLAVSSLGLTAVPSAIISGAITGGIMASATGGDFAEGFITGAISGGVSAGVGEYVDSSLGSGESILSTYSEEMGRIAGGMAGGAASGACFTVFHGGNLFDNMIGPAFSAGASATISMMMEMDIYDQNARKDRPGWMTGKSEAEIKATLIDLGWDGKSDIMFEGLRGLNDNGQPMYSNDWSDVNNKGFYHKNLFGFVDGKLVDLYYGPKGWEFNTQINRLHEYVFKAEIYNGTVGVTPPMYRNFNPSGLPNGYLLTGHNCQDATEFAIDQLAR